MIKIIILQFIIFASLLNAKSITITTGEWQPWVSVTLKKNGVAIDIVTSILKSQNLEAQVIFYPWKRSYSLAKKGKYDATAIWFKNKDREKVFDFSNEIFSTQDVLVYKKGKNIRFNTLNDLKKYKIALARGYSYGQQIDDMIKNKELNIKWVNSDLLALKQIEKRDNFDIFICAKSVAKALIEDHFVNKSIFVFYPKPIKSKPLYFLVSKKTKNRQQIMKAFNKGLKEFKSKGLVKQMIKDSYKGKYR